jgi:hypothetical protein
MSGRLSGASNAPPHNERRPLGATGSSNARTSWALLNRPRTPVRSCVKPRSVARGALGPRRGPGAGFGDGWKCGGAGGEGSVRGPRDPYVRARTRPTLGAGQENKRGEKRDGKAGRNASTFV